MEQREQCAFCQMRRGLLGSEDVTGDLRQQASAIRYPSWPPTLSGYMDSSIQRDL
jgi:hypothetical protein